MVERSQLVFRSHVLRRMVERNISATDILTVLNTGRQIEDYPTDTPYPSDLRLGYVGQRPLHVVSARNEHGAVILITVYEPTLEHWMPDFTTRRQA